MNADDLLGSESTGDTGSPSPRRSDERPHDQHCDRCDLAEFAGMTYDAAHRCGAVSVGMGLICDREAGHTGSHRGYNEQIDEPMFWGHNRGDH